MPNSAKDLIAKLDSFRPAEDGECEGQLYALLEGFESLKDREQAVAAMLRVMERLPNADLGSPGPLVHAIETTTHYRPLLRRSFAIAPSALGAWMINRILNTLPASAERSEWIALLAEVADRDGAPEFARKEAVRFLAFQRQKG